MLTPCAAGLVETHGGDGDGCSGPAVLAACAARRWLARSAAGIKLIRSHRLAPAAACTSLVSCLPALEGIELSLRHPVAREDLGSLLEALAWCPRLRALDLQMSGGIQFIPGSDYEYEEAYVPFPAPALANLSSLTSLGLSFDDNDSYCLGDVVGALVALTDLAQLSIGFPKYANIQLVPASLGQLKALRSLSFHCMQNCVLEAGCLELPKLQSLNISQCQFPGAAVLPGVSALQCLTQIEFFENNGPVTFYPELTQAPGLQRLVLSRMDDDELDPGPLRLPGDMGSLRSTLLHLDINGHTGTRFPRSLTQLVALEHLDATGNGFAKLPAGITALSRLTELILGRILVCDGHPQLHGKRPLDARALGDLSRFPGLRKLSFESCEVMLRRSVVGAARHTSLTSLCFDEAQPAPKCAPAVLQPSQELWRLGRGSVLKCLCNLRYFRGGLQAAQRHAPCQKFTADLEACRLEACGL